MSKAAGAHEMWPGNVKQGGAHPGGARKAMDKGGGIWWTCRQCLGQQLYVGEPQGMLGHVGMCWGTSGCVGWHGRVGGMSCGTWDMRCGHGMQSAHMGAAWSFVGGKACGWGSSCVEVQDGGVRQNAPGHVSGVQGMCLECRACVWSAGHVSGTLGAWLGCGAHVCGGHDGHVAWGEGRSCVGGQLRCGGLGREAASSL